MPDLSGTIPNTSAPSSPVAAATQRHVLAFLCYRRNDGDWHAEWLHQHLNGAEFDDPEGTACRLQVYYDQTAPGSASWKQIHFPSLETAHALIVVCTPGISKNFAKRGQPDWVYEELHWWLQRRTSAPIVIDATGEGDRWLPDAITKRWPDLNRIDLHRDEAEAAASAHDREFVARVCGRVIASIQQSERASVFEDLERSKRLTRRLRFWLLAAMVSLVATATLSILAWRLNTQATRSLIELLEEQGRIELLFGDPSRAVVYLSEIYARGVDTTSVRSLLSDALRWLDARGVVFAGHVDAISDAQFAPDGRTFVTASEDGTSRVWDVSTGAVRRTFKSGGKLRSVAYDPHGRMIATAGYDARVMLWDVSTGTELRLADAAGLAVRFSADGNRLFSVGRDGLRILDTASGALMAQIPAPSSTSITAFDSEGALIATADNDDIVTIWDSRTAKPVRSIKQPSGVSALQFNREGDELMVGADDGAVYGWTVGTGALRATLPPVPGAPDSVAAMTMNPQGTRLAVGTSVGLVAVWELSTQKLLWKAFRHRGSILDLTYDVTGNRLASAGVDGFARVWDSRTGALVASLKGHSSALRRVRFSPDGHQLLTASDDHEARLWQLSRFKLQSTLALSRGEEELYGSFLNGGREVIGITTGHRIGVWRTDSGQIERTFGEGIGALRVAENGDGLVSLEPLQSDGVQMRLWNAATGDVIRTIGPYRFIDARFAGRGDQILVRITSGPKSYFEVLNATNGQELLQIDDYFTDVTANRDGSLLAAIAPSANGVRLIDGRSGKVLRVVAEEHHSFHVWLSPDGAYVLTTSIATTKPSTGTEEIVEHAVDVWSATSGRWLGALKGHSDGIIDCTFSSDSKRVITSSIDLSARVWNLEQLSLVAKLDGHTGAVRTAAFSSDHQRIATASEDATVRIWDATTGRQLAILAGYDESQPTVNYVRFDAADRQLLAVGTALTVWDVSLERRNPPEISRLVEREIPWRLVGGQLIEKNASSIGARR